LKYNSTMKCPCSGKKYEDCCQPFIDGKADAPTAEALMRSRYTAFVNANINYLMKTHHAKTRPTKDKEDILQWAKSVQWMGLTICATKNGLASNQEGMVEFRALYMEKGQLKEIHEKSLFQKGKGMWFYVSGEHY